MDWQEVTDAIVECTKDERSVEGVFLSGSLVDAHKDQFSDVDLGIASANIAEDFAQTVALHSSIMSAVGRPIHYIERGWGNCKMIAALYGKSQFPPIGLEVDVIFSQLQHVSEQMPYADFEIVFDKSGLLKKALDKPARRRPKSEIVHELKLHLKGFPFYVHDALKACKRGDIFHLQSLLEEIRHALFSAAAISKGSQIIGSKRAYKCLSTSERRIIKDSYRNSSEEPIRQLANLYVSSLSSVQSEYIVEEEIVALKGTLLKLL